MHGDLLNDDEVTIQAKDKMNLWIRTISMAQEEAIAYRILSNNEESQSYRMILSSSQELDRILIIKFKYKIGGCGNSLDNFLKVAIKC